MTRHDTLVRAPGGPLDEDRLGQLRNAGLLDGPPGDDIDRWVAALRRRTGAPEAALQLLGEDGVALRTVATPAGISHPDEDDAGATGAPVDDECAVLSAPVSVDGQLLGTVAAADPGRRAWGPDDLQAIDDAASAVSTEIALRLAKRDAARAQQLVVSLAKVHDLIADAAPLADILTAVVESVERHDPSVLACVVLLDPRASTLHPGAGPSLPEAYLTAIDGVVIGPNVGTCGTAAWSGELVITEDIARDPKWAPVRHLPAQAGLQSCWSMPIKAPSGEVLGTLAFYGRRPRRPSAEQLALLSDWARVAGIAIERHRAIERLVHDARHDSLTGLANRMATLEALEDALERAGEDGPVAVFFVDLDGLKRLNDTLGHDRADEVLREVAARLTARVPEGRVVGRFGGDEFVVIAEGVADRSAAGELAVELLEAIAEPLPGRDNLVVTASIGIAIGADGVLDARELLREADSAMYAAKRSGRDRCAFYDGGHRVRSGRRVALQRALRGAETRGELRLAYEPIMAIDGGAIDGGTIVAVEAIPTWDSPGHGAIGAVELLRVAEEVGAAVPIGAWVLRESCETLGALAEHAVDRPLALAVEISRHQLEQPGFAHSVHQVLVHSRLAPDRLWLELDGTELARAGTGARRTLEELSALGIGLVLEGAGGSLCSPGSLEHLFLHAVKLDASLTSSLGDDPRHEAIAAAIVTIAAAFGFGVRAQGIEREAQRAVLERLGVATGQGPLFGSRVTGDELAALVCTRRPTNPSATPWGG